MAGLRLHSPMLHPEHYCSQRRVRGQSDWLGFLCKTLSFSVSSRFIPALSLTPATRALVAAAASSRSAAARDCSQPSPNACRTDPERPPRTNAGRPPTLFGGCSASAFPKVHLRDMCDGKITFRASLGRERKKMNGIPGRGIGGEKKRPTMLICEDGPDLGDSIHCCCPWTDPRILSLYTNILSALSVLMHQLDSQYLILHIFYF